MSLLYIVSHFSLKAFTILSLAFKFGYSVSKSGFLWVYPTWSLSSLWMCRSMFFSKFGKALDIISSTNFSAPFSHLSFGDSHYVYVGVYLVTIHLIVSHRSLQLFFLFFLLFRLGNFYWPIFRLTDFFLCHPKSAFERL